MRLFGKSVETSGEIGADEPVILWSEKIPEDRLGEVLNRAIKTAANPNAEVESVNETIEGE